MGFRNSWVAFKKTTKPAVLAAAGLRDGGEPFELFEFELGCAELQDGWVVILATDFDWAFSTATGVLAAPFTTVHAQFHEGIMYSRSSLRIAGMAVWNVSHFAHNGPLDLSITGAPPPAFEALREDRMTKQRDSTNVDYLFDVPIILAQELCGYRHDYYRFDWGEPNFTNAEPLAPPYR